MADVLSQLAQLAGPILASPQGQAMAQAVMQQMGGGGGGDPRGQMQGQGTMGRGPATDMELENMTQAQNQMRPDMPQQAGLNSDGPTPEEIKLLMSNPTPRNMANFDKLFGPGAAEQLVQGGGGNGMPPGTSYEDDVRGALDDAGKAKARVVGGKDDNDADDEGDHEYR